MEKLGKYFPIVIVFIAIVVFVVPKYFGIPFSKQYFTCTIAGEKISKKVATSYSVNDTILPIYIDKIGQVIKLNMKNKMMYNKIIYNTGFIETKLTHKEDKKLFSTLKFYPTKKLLEWHTFNQNNSSPTNIFVLNCND